MKPYDLMFAAAVLVTLGGIAVAMLSGPDTEPMRQPRMEAKLPEPPAEKAKPAPTAPKPAASEAAPQVEAEEAVVEAAPEAPAPEAPKAKTRKEMILGSWTLASGMPNMTMTFNANGTLDIYSPDMPPEMRIDATYTWDSDDRLTFNSTIHMADGNTMSNSDGATIISLTDNELVLTNDRMGMEQRFTR